MRRPVGLGNPPTVLGFASSQLARIDSLIPCPPVAAGVRHEVVIEIPADCDVEQTDETVTIEVNEEEYVLAAARSEGIWLPADCQQGWCTTCTARLESGEIDQSDARRYYEVDEEAGLILTCTAKPRSDLRIRACQHDAMLDHRADHDLPPGRSKR